jgi:protein transport protein SEC61 subunit gamma-like protein
MADQVQEMLDVPREFLKDGIQFINRAQKRMPSPSQAVAPLIRTFH